MKEKYFTNDHIANESRSLVQNLDAYRKQSSVVSSNIALLILDMQEYFLNESSHAFVPSSPALISGIRDLQLKFLEEGFPVIHTKHVNTEENAGQMNKWWRDVLNSTNSMSSITDSLRDERVTVIEKTQYDAFYETSLDSVLKEKGIERVVVTGLMTHLCLETTVRSCFVRGYEVYAPIDGTATYNRDFHISTMRNLLHGFCSPTYMSDFDKLFNGGSN